jgi:hypothetical protein
MNQKAAAAHLKLISKRKTKLNLVPIELCDREVVQMSLMRSSRAPAHKLQGVHVAYYHLNTL